jgi:hypothetical protein
MAIGLGLQIDCQSHLPLVIGDSGRPQVQVQVLDVLFPRVSWGFFNKLDDFQCRMMTLDPLNGMAPQFATNEPFDRKTKKKE